MPCPLPLVVVRLACRVSSRRILSARNILIGERLDAPHLPIRAFDEPSLAKEAVKGDAATTFLVSGATVVPTVIEKRLGRLKIFTGPFPRYLGRMSSTGTFSM
jgi:hypothetical protein